MMKGGFNIMSYIMFSHANAKHMWMEHCRGKELLVQAEITATKYCCSSCNYQSTFFLNADGTSRRIHRPIPDGQQTSDCVILAFHCGRADLQTWQQENRNTWTHSSSSMLLGPLHGDYKCPVWKRVYLEVNLSTLSPSRNFMALQWILPQFSGCPRGPCSSWMYCSHRSSWE